MAGKAGIMICKLNRWMDNYRHYDMEIKGWMEKMVLRSKGGTMMCKLKGLMDKGHYDVQIMRWMQKVAL